MMVEFLGGRFQRKEIGMMKKLNAAIKNYRERHVSAVEVVSSIPVRTSDLSSAKKRVRRISIALVCLLVPIAIFLFFVSGKERPVRTIVIDQGPIVANVSVSGKIVAAREVDLSPKGPATIAAVHVREGDSVKQGQILISLDAREPNAIASKSEANVRQVEEELSQARGALERMKRLYEVGGESRQSVEDAESRLRSLTAKIQVARDELRVAQIGLQDTQIRAPFSGLVVSIVAQVGQLATPGSGLLTVADLTERQIEAKVDAGDGGLIQVGQRALLETDAFPDRQWRETVLRLAPTTDQGGISNVFSVRLSLGADAPALRLGQQVDLKIEVASKTDAVRIPIAALVNRDNGAVAMTISDGRIRFVPVRTGMEDLSHVEILTGLQPGDEIVLPEKTTLIEGERVRAIMSNRT